MADHPANVERFRKIEIYNDVNADVAIINAFCYFFLKMANTIANYSNHGRILIARIFSTEAKETSVQRRSPRPAGQSGDGILGVGQSASAPGRPISKGV